MKTVFYIKTLCALLIILVSSGVWSQTYWIEYNTTNSGLPSNIVGKLVIDRNNVKWMTTYQKGLVKFDGVNWTVYDTTNSGLPRNEILFPCIDRNNNIWMNPIGKGLVKFDGANWTIYNTTNSGMPSNSFTGLACDSNNNLWFGALHKLYKFDGTNFYSHDTNSGFPYATISNIAVENSNILWIGTLFKGLLRFDGFNFIEYNASNSGMPCNWVNGIFIDDDNYIWLGTRFGGAVRFNYTLNQWIIHDMVAIGLGNNEVTDAVRKNEYSWFGTGFGLVRYHNNNYTLFGYPINSTLVPFLTYDKYGNLWISTGNGLYVHNPNGIVNIDNGNISKLATDYVINIYPNPFNGTAKLDYKITKSGFVQIKLYDITGKRISNFVNSKQNNGNYKIFIDLNNLPSGVYYCILTVDNNYIQSKKIVLLK